MRRPIALPPWPEPDPYDDPVAMALVAEVCERDPRSVSAAGVASRAGLSLSRFHERFADFDDCLLDSFERLAAAYEHRIGSIFNDHSEWRAGIRAAAYETASWMEDNPLMVEFGAFRVLRLENEMVSVRREELFFFFARMIDRGREEAEDPESVPESAPLVAIGSIVQLITHRVQAGVNIQPRTVVPELLYSIVRLYLGDEAAEEEITLPPPGAD